MDEFGLNTAPLDVLLGATFDVVAVASGCLGVTGIACIAGGIVASCFTALLTLALHSTTPIGLSLLGRGLDRLPAGLLTSTPSLSSSEKSRWIRFSAEGVPGEWSGPVCSERDSSGGPWSGCVGSSPGRPVMRETERGMRLLGLGQTVTNYVIQISGLRYVVAVAHVSKSIRHNFQYSG